MSHLAERFIDRTPKQESIRSPYSVQEVVIAGVLGPCGGVRTAVKTTEIILDYVKKREPVYANNDPIHNRLITESFKARGLIIEPVIDRIPDGSIWITSAHGEDTNQVREANAKGLRKVKTECRLVTGVKTRAIQAEERGDLVVYRGTTDHPEPRAIQSVIKEDANFIFVNEKTELDQVSLPDNRPITVLNQTTLSTRGVIEEINVLRILYPDKKIPNPAGICYATDNRQDSLYELFSMGVKPIDFLIVVGSQNSHNSKELRKIGEDFLGEENSRLVDSPDDIDPAWFTGDIKRVGLTSGASALDDYTVANLEWFWNRGSLLTFLTGKEDDQRYQDLTFPLPIDDINSVKVYIDLKYAA